MNRSLQIVDLNRLGNMRILRSAINHNGIPFEVKRPTPNEVTKTVLDEYEEMKKNPGNYRRYKSFDDVLDEVLGDA